jgi:hypothetical protein
MSLHRELNKIVHRLQHLADCNPTELRDGLDVHLNDATTALAAVANRCPVYDEDPLPATPVEGIGLLRRVRGPSSALFVSESGSPFAVVTALEDGAVGWQPPNLSLLNGEQLHEFRRRFADIDKILATEQSRRAS